MDVEAELARVEKSLAATQDALEAEKAKRVEANAGWLAAEKLRSLDFARLRAINVERCVKGFGHALDSWSVAEWTNAMCGEAGEAANVAKKMLRHRDNVAGNKGADLDLEALRQKLGRELADTVIYLDLVCASQGLDLGQLVRETFNAKSDEIGAKEKL